jgi:hypothetical protein
VLAVDLDRLKHQRQAGRRGHCVGSDLVVLEDLDLACADIGGREEKFDRATTETQRPKSTVSVSTWRSGL